MKNCCDPQTTTQGSTENLSHTIALIGNPNSGKTTLFNRLTGTRQRTGNWPGVTVEQKSGQFSISGNLFEVIDLPGTYSLNLSHSSLDEQIARSYVKQHNNDLYINIIDTTTLEKSLYLTSQLREQGIPVIVLLNMIDMADKLNLIIDTEQLSQQLQCPVITFSLNRDKDLNKLLTEIAESQHQQPCSLGLTYIDALENALSSFQASFNCERLFALNELEKASLLTSDAKVTSDAEHNKHGKTSINKENHENTQTLENNQFLENKKNQENQLTDKAIELSQDVYQKTSKTIFQLIAQEHYVRALQIATDVTSQSKPAKNLFTDKIDRWVLGNVTGVPVFLLIMYLLFLFSINIGGAFIDFFDLTVEAFLVNGLDHLLTDFGIPQWIRIILAQGIGGGVQVVATFIPIIGALYLFLTLLEESGYMSRAAFVMDRSLQKLGISGKAFVPLIIGFGCNVPAIMATRTMDSHRERILTVLMAPFMSCGARLTVFALFAATFFPQGGQNIVFLLYLTGVGFAILTALILKNTILKGNAQDFLMELPGYQLPGLQNVLINTWNKLKGFVLGAGKIIVIVVMIINVVNSLGTDLSFGNEDSSQSVLSATAQTITPIFAPMGIEQDNWPATVGIITGVLAKEVVVGTLDSLYSNMDNKSQDVEEEPPFDLSNDLITALETIPVNLADAMNNLTDPLGLGVIDETENQQQAALKQEVNVATMTAMQSRFDGKTGAFAYMLFILLYSPCIAAAGAMFRETGKNWAILGISWSTGLAYGSAVIFYQMATFFDHPLQSTLWSGGILGLFLSALYVLFRKSKHSAQIPIQVNFN